MRYITFILLLTVGLVSSGKAEAWTLFGNLRGNCYDHRYYASKRYDMEFVGYEDLYNYPYTYKLPWNRCFNYCTCYPKPCWCRPNTQRDR